MTLPFFDGKDSMIARAWLQKVQTYFSLKPMVEWEAVQFAVIHLTGTAYEWWHNGLVTRDHGTIESFEVFANKLLDRFERQDANEYFDELATIRQKTNVADYVEEFQKISMMITNVAEDRIIHFFVKGLSDPIRGWVKAFKPQTVDEAVGRALDLESSNSSSKSKWGQPTKLSSHPTLGLLDLYNRVDSLGIGKIRIKIRQFSHQKSQISKGQDLMKQPEESCSIRVYVFHVINHGDLVINVRVISS